MRLHKHLRPLFILWFCSYYSCYSNSQEDALNNYLKEASSYDNQAYPTFFGFIDELESEVEYSKLSRSDDYEDERFGLGSFIKQIVPKLHLKLLMWKILGLKVMVKQMIQRYPAFEEAWKEACSSFGSVLIVPKNKNYLLKPIKFRGPCKSDLTVQIQGTITASDDRCDYKKDRQHWLVFDNIDNLIVDGGGTIDGNGEIWWKNSCKINKTLAITFNDCKNLRVKNLRIKDAQQMHIVFQKCVNVQAINLLVTAPEKSPNTDGIHITNTQNIQIMSSVIKTGDDCISIVDGARNVQATDITCGPGHGISIGSLGKAKSESHVSDVKVDRAKFIGTTNGVRIKTWQKSAVQVQDVVYKNIKGTSASHIAIKIDCSKNFPCKDILMQDVNLVGVGDEKVNASCINLLWSKNGTVIPSCPDEPGALIV
ncbi:hypothetical protein IFM89_017330 [Coptis chinensis]|uniref:Polygalacturonase n=1 Tax=Coptis chinensis TaxID=261450 RepID=A0A835H3L5_9MAGN|nr:hypothetical protein IFM89_017330 [Coptis chinensis]